MYNKYESQEEHDHFECGEITAMAENPPTPSQTECKYCYGKGYSSVMFDEIGSPDLGAKGFVNKRKEVKKPCRCQDEPNTTCPICEDEKCHWDCGEEELITSDDLINDLEMSWAYIKGLIEGLKETELNQITAIRELSDYIEFQREAFENVRNSLAGENPQKALDLLNHYLND